MIMGQNNDGLFKTPVARIGAQIIYLMYSQELCSYIIIYNLFIRSHSQRALCVALLYNNVFHL